MARDLANDLAMARAMGRNMEVSIEKESLDPFFEGERLSIVY